jgi:hypothetical protein
MKKIPYISSLCVLVFCVATFLYLGYLKVWPMKVVVFDSDKIELGMNIIKAGAVMPMKYPFTKYANIFPTIHRRIVNEVVYQLPTMQGSTGPGRMDRWVYSTVIPAHLPPGKYKIIIDFVFNLNFLRDYTVTISSDYFFVVR